MHTCIICGILIPNHRATPYPVTKTGHSVLYCPVVPFLEAFHVYCAYVHVHVHLGYVQCTLLLCICTYT